MSEPKRLRWNAMFMLAFGLMFGGVAGITLTAMWTRGCVDVKDAPFGCTEFWLFRYQALGAAGIAGSIAIFAAKLVVRQIIEMQRQSAALARATLVEEARELESEHTQIWEKIVKLEAALIKTLKINAAVLPPKARVRSFQTRVAEMRTLLIGRRAREHGSQKLCSARRELLDAAGHFYTSCRRYREINLSPDEVAKRFERMKVRYAAFSARLAPYGKVLEDEIAARWKKANEYARAIAPAESE